MWHAFLLQISSLLLYCIRTNGSIHLPHPHWNIWKLHNVFTSFSIFWGHIRISCIWNLSFRTHQNKMATQLLTSIIFSFVSNEGELMSYFVAPSECEGALERRQMMFMFMFTGGGYVFLFSINHHYNQLII